MKISRILTSKWMIFLPIFGIIPWGGMLIGMISAWAIQGHPLYWFMDSYQYPVYISDVGATSLQPLFIVGVAVNVAVFLMTLALIMYLRDRYDKWFEKDGERHNRNLAIAAISFAVLGELGILFVSIFNTNIFHKTHIAMLGIFLLGLLVSLILQCTQYWRMGDVIGHGFNHYKISFVLKLVFTVVALALAIAFYKVSDYSKSAAIEWSLAFFYNLIFFIFAYDLYVLNTSIQRERNSGPHQGDLTENEKSAHSTMAANNDEETIV
ncbi:hypothetical protein WICPIJ_009783 [Wickerhamomyces pijperi]|uniref:CWH43-like N-terminal domain-containing protein n=1 Tax=Wickerhamomyces pijperi TaxID=599730 RepID=A0A9P8PKU7_WICPI|nr:hypothetical protein WICPIJ_009783 [Wickerhamomyces pijperi]